MRMEHRVVSISHGPRQTTGEHYENTLMPSNGVTSPAFRILSLDGGGIRGAFTAACLARFQKELNRPIADYFDLIAGTSTGAIIGIALGLGESPETIEEFYRKIGTEIFVRRDALPIPWFLRPFRRVADRYLKTIGIDCDWICQSKYDLEQLTGALTDVFGTRTLGQATRRLVIPAVDLTCGRTVVFKTPHLPGLIRDRSMTAVDAVLATTAAPSYFPHATVRTGSAYVDGGLWANNPSMVAYVEAMKIRAVCTRPSIDPQFQETEVAVLSIGTGEPKYSHGPPLTGAGLGWWGPRILDVVAISQSQGAQFQAAHILGERYQRVNFDVPDSSWRLDATQYLDRLIHIGRQKATECFARLRPQFFLDTALPFHPFD